MNTQEVEVTVGEQVGFKAQWDLAHPRSGGHVIDREAQAQMHTLGDLSSALRTKEHNWQGI